MGTKGTRIYGVNKGKFDIPSDQSHPKVVLKKL
jgi:hypothetical protein